MENNLQKIIIITGPTASGKSDLAVSIALKKNQEEKIVCEVISADSRQIYKHLDIGTGKINIEEMKNIKHYGLNIYEPKYENENTYKKFTTADWLRYTQEKINNITSENKIPIICGGTGLYIDALLYGITDNPNPDENFRLIYKDKTLLEIQNKIKKNNLEFFNNLNNSEQNNKERLIRKLEILTKNNSIINEAHTRDLKYNVLEFIILNPNKEILENNIKIRCKKRWYSMLSETKDLLENKKIDKEWLRRSGLEYEALIKYIDGEIKSENECKEYIIQKSIRYSKRQVKWNVRWVGKN